jgi:hypothetical protein
VSQLGGVHWLRRAAILVHTVVKFAPSTAKVSFRTKLTENFQLLRFHLAERKEPVDFGWLFEDLDEYDSFLRKYAGPPLADAKVFEVGYGARPHRLTALLSMGVDARGVDAEVPILDGSLQEFRTIFAENGIERVAKSLVRHILFDRRERAAFARELTHRGYPRLVDKSRFLVSDAAKVEIAPESLDLIYSENVFEHIGRDSLEKLVPKMARWLKPTGLALVRPDIFTGITGGHFVEWYPRSFARQTARRRSAPWEHLRKRRFRPNTSLNELTRADFRALFAEYFEILEEVVKLPDLGREFLVGEVASDLASYPDEELFSNQVLFVLRPR